MIPILKQGKLRVREEWKQVHDLYHIQTPARVNGCQHSGTTCGHLVAQLGCEHHLISSTDLHWHRAGARIQRGDSALLLWVSYY